MFGSEPHRRERRTEADVRALPPLPRPDRATMCAEATCGCTLVLVVVAVLVATTESVASSLRPESYLSILGRIAILTEAAVALACLCGLMFGDPGVVKRSVSTCFPMPRQVADALEREGKVQLQHNIVEGQHEYCTRCLLWRGTKSDGCHHCSTCQRCVRAFDHHCGVFGRCIAGNGYGGNMGYFKVLISMGGAGIFTAMTFSLASMAEHITRGGDLILAVMTISMTVGSCCCCSCVMWAVANPSSAPALV
ncbi:hypothetical protein AB1Y20_009739 [Prymnesium parvum]|uniref:Palmitoyltransferase n=1 Tax=Prymnesium parvum TaxID=97485 RepID=A0AB34K177_PRYPA